MDRSSSEVVPAPEPAPDNPVPLRETSAVRPMPHPIAEELTEEEELSSPEKGPLPVTTEPPAATLRIVSVSSAEKSTAMEPEASPLSSDPEGPWQLGH